MRTATQGAGLLVRNASRMKLLSSYICLYLTVYKPAPKPWRQIARDNKRACESRKSRKPQQTEEISNCCCIDVAGAINSAEIHVSVTVLCLPYAS